MNQNRQTLMCFIAGLLLGVPFVNLVCFTLFFLFAAVLVFLNPSVRFAFWSTLSAGLIMAIMLAQISFMSSLMLQFGSDFTLIVLLCGGMNYLVIQYVFVRMAWPART